MPKLARLGLRLLKIATTNPSRLSHILGTALYKADEVADRATDLMRFECVMPEDLLPNENETLTQISLALFPKTHASLSVLEWTCLVLLLKKARAKSVFEFGTYKGVSIAQLALNLDQAAEIRTLDLPDKSTDIQFAIPDPDELQIAQEGGKGSLIPTELRPRIQFLKQDSAKFDEGSLAGKVDFVFVDGAHSYDYVKSDSAKGWRMLRSGGIIAWHDCRKDDPDVVRCLLESNYKPARIVGTSLAFAAKP
jgi:predicted O-methyltransferase YrrM